MAQKTYAFYKQSALCAGLVFLVASCPRPLNAQLDFRGNLHYRMIVTAAVGYAAITVSNFIADMLESARQGVAGQQPGNAVALQNADVAGYFDAAQWPASVKEVALPVFNKYIEVSIIDLIVKVLQAGMTATGVNPDILLIAAVWKCGYKIPTVGPAKDMVLYLKDIFEKNGIQAGLESARDVLLGILAHFNALTLAHDGAQRILSETGTPIAFKTLERLFETLGLLFQTTGDGDKKAINYGIKTSKAGWAIGKTAPAAIDEITK